MKISPYFYEDTLGSMYTFSKRIVELNILDYNEWYRSKIKN